MSAPLLPALRGPARCALIALGIGTGIVGTNTAYGYALIGGAWPTGNVTMQLQLDATKPATPTLPLTDGSVSWNAVAQSAMADWNAVLGRSKFNSVVSSSTTATEGDGISSVFFGTTIYGDAFDSRTLAVTLVDNLDTDGIPTVKIHEADLIVNNANRTWNSYRGAINSSPLDLRRVLLHELGHVLGLDHPDLAHPAQSVTAIMNSTVSNLETLQTDDIDGVNFLYHTALFVPTAAQLPTAQSVSVGHAATINVAVNGAPTAPAATPLFSYTWYFKAQGTSAFEKLFTVDATNLDFGVAQLTDAGTYYVQLLTPDTSINSNESTLTVNAVTTASATQLVNVSTRALAGSSTQPMTVGFVIAGSRNKSVLIRAVGPTLASSFGMAGTLADPLLVLKDKNQNTIATSPVQWDADSTTAQTLRDTTSRSGAFPLAAGSTDAVLLVSLPGGNANYTAQAVSRSGKSGIVLIEAYDADTKDDRSANPTSRIINLSTRGFVGTNDNIMIAGFSVDGPGPHTYLIRVSGPTLAKSPWNLTGTLYDPYLKLYSSGANPVLLRQTDDWDSPSATQPILSAAFTQTGAFNLTDRKESAMLVTLPAGTYTAQASGNDNDGSTDPTGQALIEIYEVNN